MGVVAYAQARALRIECCRGRVSGMGKGSDATIHRYSSVRAKALNKLKGRGRLRRGTVVRRLASARHRCGVIATRLDGKIAALDDEI